METVRVRLLKDLNTWEGLLLAGSEHPCPVKLARQWADEKILQIISAPESNVVEPAPAAAAPTAPAPTNFPPARKARRK